MVTHWDMAAKGQLCWEGGSLGPGTCCAPSPAPPEQGSGTEVALPAALGAALGAQSRAPLGWVLAHPPVEEGMSGCSLIWGQVGCFGAWCLFFCGMGRACRGALPCLSCGLTTEVSPPSHGSRSVQTGVQDLRDPSFAPCSQELSCPRSFDAFPFFPPFSLSRAAGWPCLWLDPCPGCAV